MHHQQHLCKTAFCSSNSLTVLRKDLNSDSRVLFNSRNSSRNIGMSMLEHDDLESSLLTRADGSFSFLLDFFGFLEGEKDMPFPLSPFVFLAASY